jgi:hypothetical protein
MTLKGLRESGTEEAAPFHYLWTLVLLVISRAMSLVDVGLLPDSVEFRTDSALKVKR